LNRRAGTSTPSRAVKVTIGVQPWVGGEIGRGRSGEPLRFGGRPVLLHEEIGRLIRVGVDIGDPALVGRKRGGVLAGPAGEPGESAAFAAHLVEMILVRRILAGGDIEMRFVARLADGQHFPIAGRQSARLAAIPGHRVKVRIAGALGLEVDFAAVLHPTQRVRAGTVNPGVVMVVRQHPRLPGGGIQGEDPAVFVVGGAAQQRGLGAILAPDRHRQIDLAFRRLGDMRCAPSLLDVGRWRRGLDRRRGKRARRTLLAVIHPFHLARRHIEHRQAPTRLRVAHVGAATRVFRVSRVGDPLGDHGVPGGGGFHHGGDRVFFVGRKSKFLDRLARLQREWLARVFSLAFCLGLLMPRRTIADSFEKLLLFLLQALLAGAGGFLVRSSLGRRPAAPPTPPAGSTREARWRRLRRSGCANLGHLLDVAGAERHDEEVAAAREVDAFAVGQKMRVGLGLGGVSDLADLAVGRVVKEQVALAGKHGEPQVARDVAVERRRLLRFRVAELAWRRSGALHHISIERRGR
jgi:hypothetical protein